MFALAMGRAALPFQWTERSANRLDGRKPTVHIRAREGAAWINGRKVPMASALSATSGSKRVIGPTGTLDTVAANAVAFDWSSGRRRLLGEAAQATNSAWPSTAFGGSSRWGKGGVSATDGALAAPDGSMTATKLIEDTSTGGHQLYANHAVVVGPNVTSIYAKPGPRSNIQISIVTPDGGYAYARFNLATGNATPVYGAATIAYGMTFLPTTGYYRCWVSYTCATSGSNTAYIALHNGSTSYYAGDGTSWVGLWGAQTEAGSYPTSYPPTTTASATRIADDVRLSVAALAQVTGAGGCTIVLRGSVVSGGVILSDSSTDQTVISDPTATRLASRGVVVPSGSGDPRNAFGMAVALSSSGGKAALNGGAVTVLPSTPIVGPMRIGSGVSGGWACGPIFLDELVIWPFVGSDAGLRAQARIAA